MFKDKIKEILMPQIEIPKLKGHTKIELTDVYTGKKEIVEHDNVFQSAVIAKFMRSMGRFNANPFGNANFTSNTMIKNLIGGIFCFKDTITAGTKYMPAGNIMVANGAMDTANGSTPTELGSYNDIESEITGSSIKFVYDWGTSQGNGEIGCICLTSNTGGFVGYGNASGGIISSPRFLNENQSSAAVSRTPCGNIGYQFNIDETNKKLQVTKTYLCVSELSLFDNTTKETVEISYTTTLISGANSTKAVDYIGSGKFLIMPSAISQISNNSTRNFLIYDSTTDTITEGKIINTTGANIAGMYSSYRTFKWYGANENYIYCLKNSRDVIYKFDIVTGILLETLSLTNVYGQSDTTNNKFSLMSKIAPDLFGYGADNVLIIYDSVNDTLYPCNAKGTTTTPSGNGWAYATYCEEIDAFIGENQGYMSYQNYTNGWGSPVFKNPLYLATINNLDTPVLKTASKTMKITYTLTEAA